MVNLGVVSTVESRNGDRVLNTLDNFAYFYNNMYKTTIYGQGNIGDIFIYIDSYIMEDKIAFYYDDEEFIFNFDEKMVNEKGVDFYIGHLIKTIETEYKERVKKEEDKIETQKKEIGDPNMVINNPGNVKYADLKAYLDKIRTERLKS